MAAADAATRLAAVTAFQAAIHDWNADASFRSEVRSP